MRFFEYAFNLIYPNVCGMCGRLCQESLCKKCEIKLNKIAKIKIDRYEDKYFTKHLSAFKYEGMIKQKLIDYKFNEKSYLYKSIAKFLLNSKKVCAFLESYDIIIPVPIHKYRRRERGYNQSALIARKLARSVEGLTYNDSILYKEKNIAPQSNKTKEQRKKDVIGVYSLRNQEKIKGKKILLLDDIYTTGSTVNECCRMLREACVATVDVITIAKD